jgi:hypothetical protein
MLFLGDDWAEAHHDVELQGEQGTVLARRRLPEGVAGLAQLHALIAEHLGEDDEPADVLVGIETDRGPWVQALIATGYVVYAINPMQASRYRERHSTSGAKSDPGMRTCWLRSCAPTAPITGRSPGTASRPRSSRLSRARISR